MPEYKLSILVEGADRGAGDVLLHLHSGLGALNVALGTLVADGLRMATGALIDFGKSGLKVATDYQGSMNMFQAVSGATGDQMAAIGAEAKRLGADMSLPATSAGDAAKAMTELAKAGLSVDNALKAGKGTLQLAAAGAISEAQAAEIAANALNSFGLSGDKATMVADLFAAAANKSSLEVTDVADGFKMASAVFSAFQGPVVGSEKALKDLTTAMALLGNVGIKGSDAGTSLKQMMLQLTGPSQKARAQMQGLMASAMGYAKSQEDVDKILLGNDKARTEALQVFGKAGFDVAKMGDIAYDAAGKMRPLEEIVNLVSMATKNMTDKQRNAALTEVFGADATRAIIGLMRAGPDAFKEMETAISQQGAAGELAGARMKGLGGAWEGFKSTLETTQLAMMEPLLGPLEVHVRGAALALAAATPALEEFGKGLGTFISGKTFDGMTQMSIALGHIFGPEFGRVAFATMIYTARGIRFLHETVTAVMPTVLSAASIMGQFIGAFVSAPDKIAFFKDRLIGLASAGFDQLKAYISAALPGWTETLRGWRLAAVQWVIDAIPGALAALQGYADQVKGWALASLPGWIEGLKGWALGAGAWALEAIPTLLLNLLEMRNRAVAWVIEQAPGWAQSFKDKWGPALWQWISTDGAKMLTDFAGKQLDLLKIIGGAVPSFDLEFGKWGATALGWIPTYEEFKVAADAFVDGIWPWIKEKVPLFGENMASWSTAFIGWIGPAFGKLIIAAGGAFGDFLTWITKDETAKDILMSLGSWTLAFVKWSAVDLPIALVNALGGLQDTVWAELVRLWGEAFAEGSLGKSLVDGILKGLGESWASISAWFSAHWGDLLSAIPGFSAVVTAAHGAGIPGFANGVRNFGGGMALVGERGPELVNLPGGSGVIPAGATRGMMGGGSTLNIGNATINIYDARDPQAAAKAVREELIKLGKRNNGLGGIFGGYG